LRLWSESSVREEFDLSASDNMIAPPIPILFLLRLSEVRVVLDLSASYKKIAASAPILLLPVLFENEMQ
jgi:hypothetical protein